jgi:CBS domain-containing protein
MQVRELMRMKPVCCTPSCTARLAASIMNEVDTGVVPVLEKLGKKVLGVVTDRDLCLKVIARGRNPDCVQVAECMTANPISCRSGDDLHTALELMRYYQIRRILVVNAENEIEGVLSIGDLIRSDRTSTEQVMNTLRSICEPNREASGTEHRVFRKAA